jgi:cytochrome c peroxidase
MFTRTSAVRGACVGLMVLGISAVPPPGFAADETEADAAGGARGRDINAVQLRRSIDREVGGIRKLMVPANDADIPVPRTPGGRVDPQFKTTEAKRYLGKLLFHDPVRSVRIRPEFGGILATRQSASCASCHLGEAASKSGTLLNFAVGAEGRGYTDAQGNFVPRRRPLPNLPVLRRTPLFKGDARVDALPTLTDVYERAVGTPARGRKLPDPGRLVRSGRFDALDSVGRHAPSVIGAAFNNRLLLGGFAGEPDASPGGLNPFGHPAQENLTLLLLDAHRMLEDQSAVLQQVRPFVKLFQDAFPEEAAEAGARNDKNILINDVTVLRATATFLRTSVTRNTPFDRFLAGDDRALTPAQRRGASLFFTPATEGGAGCASCHAGPMLNKQVNDPDVAGVGSFVEENFFNLGLRDHPLQALNRLARGDRTFRDDGRREITFRDDDAFEFRSLTLRQLKDGRFFMHNGSFTSVREVVRYFNAGMPQDAEAAAANTFSDRFAYPRGPGSARGLGLSGGQVNDLTEFLEDGLYDPGFVRDDPRSPTRKFGPTVRDLAYSRFRPDLAALGARDGLMPSGLPMGNNDALSRRDMGLEFLDVTARASVVLTNSDRAGGGQRDTYAISNTSSSVIDTHLLVVVEGISGRRVRLLDGDGFTSTGDPYVRVFLDAGVLPPGRRIAQTLRFAPVPGGGQVRYRVKLLSGQGNP